MRVIMVGVEFFSFGLQKVRSVGKINKWPWQQVFAAA